MPAALVDLVGSGGLEEVLFLLASRALVGSVAARAVLALYEFSRTLKLILILTPL